MRLSAKIFLCTITVITIALSLTGYLLIGNSFENAVIREKQRGLEEYQLLKFSMQSGMLSAYEKNALGWESLLTLSMQTSEIAPSGDICAVFNSEGVNIFSTFPEDFEFPGLLDIEEGGLSYYTREYQGKYLFIMLSRISQSDTTVYFYVARDISSVITEKTQMLSRYAIVYSAVILASCGVMFILSQMLTNPIRKLMRISRRIANGKYDERVFVSASDEIGELSDSFNRMASTVEDKINELYLNAQQKEDFVGNFAHELKTPLTSVIGYADMIYQKDLPKDKVHEAAGYIINEGMRLEALAHKMMELIVMNRTEFVLVEMRADELLMDVRDTLLPMMEQKNIKLEVVAEEAYIRIEFDLFKTLLLNLADNAAKAESTRIELRGKYGLGKYRISVSDNGRGIPKEQLGRITEAFYMVDKSRSRKQHGAGLGLAIAKKIADIHETELKYESSLGIGTTVSVELPVQPPMEEDYEEEN